MPADISGKDAVTRALTVYNDGFALVKEERTLPSFPEDGVLRYLDVAQRIETESILVDGVRIRELNYEYDLVDKNKLLEKYIGRELSIVDRETGKARRFRLLSAQNGIVGEDVETGEIVLDPEGEIRLPELPGGLILRPALVWLASPEENGDGRVRMSYLTGGMSWETDYVIGLPAETGGEEEFRLTGWMTLRNESGMTFENAKLRVIAGTVNRASSPFDARIIPEQVLYSQAMPEHESFADYHMYTVPQPVTVKDRQQKQIKLLEADEARGHIVYEATYHDRKPAVFLEFRNSAESGLGFPLPKGRVKMYRENPSDGTSEFIGEDRIGHTAKDENIRLLIGEAFDVTIDSGRADTEKTGRYEDETYVYEIRNAKETGVDVLIRHAVRDRHWEILDSNFPAERRFNEVRIRAHAKAGEETVVLFTLRFDRSVTVTKADEE
ncbi:DUF4139 domain-containing protein [Bhargavaea cecembensis]|uniref:DUF4139 domain-containing protein n=1 Tax=Bhargavaea cecembensis TaxID=394098 RepID=UPI0008411920|nr:hypothetical protein [Bhargavaea cecembensis]